MKKLMFLGFVSVIIASCNTRTGELTGVLGRRPYHPRVPLGMVYIPSGGFNMGQSDQDMPFLHQTRSKTASVQAFYMDQTEITNNEYRQFVYWVRDSIARDKIYETMEDDEASSDWINYKDEYFDEGALEYVEFDASDRALNREIFSLNWDRRLDYTDPELVPLLADMYYPTNERFYKRREFDTRKLRFRYYWIDLVEAAKRGRVEIVTNGYDKMEIN